MRIRLIEKNRREIKKSFLYNSSSDWLYADWNMKSNSGNVKCFIKS